MKINRLFRQYENLILNPIKQYPVEFIVILLLLCFPVIYISSDSSFWRFKTGINILLLRHNNGQLLFDIALSYILTVSVYRLCKINKVGFLFFIFIELFLAFVAFTEIFLFDNFSMDINFNVFQLVNETNNKESSEFISTYLLKYCNIKYLLVFILLPFTQLFLRIKYDKICKTFCFKAKYSSLRIFFQKALVLYISICLLFFMLSIPLFSLSWKENIRLANMYPLRITQTLTLKIFNTILPFNDLKNCINKCADSQNHIIAELKGDTIDNIVLVIGESYNRHHASLYGYNKNTNPFLSKIDNLYVFDNVISSINGTSKSFENFLSTSSVGGIKRYIANKYIPIINNLMKEMLEYMDLNYTITFNDNFDAEIIQNGMKNHCFLLYLKKLDLM